MLLAHYEKVHVMHRSFSEKPGGRTLVGVVEHCEAGVARIHGHIYAVDPATSKLSRRPEAVTRFISLVSGEHIVTPLPDSVEMENLVYTQDGEGLRVTDGSSWALHINTLSLQ